MLVRCTGAPVAGSCSTTAALFSPVSLPAEWCPAPAILPVQSTLDFPCADSCHNFFLYPCRILFHPFFHNILCASNVVLFSILGGLLSIQPVEKAAKPLFRERSHGGRGSFSCEKVPPSAMRGARAHPPGGPLLPLRGNSPCVLGNDGF